MDAYVDNLQRQLDEIEAAVQGDPPVQEFQLPNISGTVKLPGVKVRQAPVSLHFQLPSGYPSMATPQLLVECTAPRWLHEHLTTAIQLAAEQALGNESLLLLLDQLQPGFPGVLIAEGSPVGIREYLSRIRGLTWQAMQLRGEQLVQCSRCVADAGGAGVIQPIDIHAEASSRHSSTAHELHGQRGSHDFVEAPRVFNGRFVELAETGGLGELGQFCTAAGIEDLFLKALKIAR
eukprot:gene3234-3511_t